MFGIKDLSYIQNGKSNVQWEIGIYENRLFDET